MEVKQLKEYILENNFIETILENIGCHSISHKDGMYQCANKNGDNKQAITVYENEALITINYTRKMIKGNRQTDLIDLVCFNEDLSFSEGLKFIADLIGISYYHDFDEDVPESLQITKLIFDMNSHNDEKKDKPLKPISKKILSYYKPYVNDMFKNDNISYSTQKEFEIGYDESTNRITIPIYSSIGDLVGVKGRLFKKDLEPNEMKYIYLEPTARSKVLYGLNKTYDAIKARKIVYVVEAEKGVLQLYTYGYCNCVATGGKKISRTQIEMLTRLGVHIVFAFDKDVNKKELEEIAEEFEKGIPIYAIYDKNNILDEKESPTDNPDKWETLVKNNLYRIR